MSYFELVPSDLNNIILSYLSIYELKKLLKQFNFTNLNWNTIHAYHFSSYQIINEFMLRVDYLNKLSLEDLLYNELRMNRKTNHFINIKYLDLGFRYLKKIPKGLNYLVNLQILNLDHNQIVKIPEGCFNGLTHLQILNLSNNLIEELQEGAFSTLSNLKELYLNNNRVKYISNGSLSNLSILTKLHIYGNPIKREDVLEYIKNIHTLEIDYVNRFK